LQKGWILCQEEMEQGLRAGVPGQDVVWVKAKVRVEAGWAARMPQDRAVVVYARVAEQRLHILQASLVIKEAVLNVVRK